MRLVTYAFHIIRFYEMIIYTEEVFHSLETSYSVHIVFVGGGGCFTGGSLQIGEGPLILKRCLSIAHGVIQIQGDNGELT